MSLPAISKHLKVLERAGLIARGREAQWRPCRLEAGPLKDAADWLEHYRAFLGTELRSPGRLPARAASEGEETWTQDEALTRRRGAGARHHPHLRCAAPSCVPRRGRNPSRWRAGGGRRASHDYCNMDVRPGGAFRFCMRSPGGRRALEAGRLPRDRGAGAPRLHLCLGGCGGQTRPPNLVTVTFAEHGDKTELTLHQAVFETVERAMITGAAGRAPGALRRVFGEKPVRARRSNNDAHIGSSRATSGWPRARQHLAKEKEFTRLRDQLSAERRALPWVKVEKPLCLRRPGGQGDARRPVRRAQPADRQAFHVRPGLEGGLRRLLVRGRPHRGRSGAPRAPRRELCGRLARAPAEDRSLQEAHGLALQMGVVVRQRLQL